MTQTAQIALISGGAAGICHEVAIQLSSLDYQVVVVDRDKQALKQMEEMNIPQLSTYAFDVEQENDIQQLFEQLATHQKLPTVLVNGVGGDARRIPFQELNQQDLMLSLQQNLFTAFNMSRFAIPHMVRQKYGRIINFASIAGRTYTVFSNTGYVCAKSAVMGLTKQMAYEFADQGITVNTVAHGPIATARIQDAWQQKTEQEKQQILQYIPMGRLGEISEAAAAIVHLCAPESGYMTGATVDINGGMYI